MDAPSPILATTTGDLLDRIAAGDGAPAGAVAALVVASSAALVTRVARASAAGWPEAGGIAAQSEALRARVAPLAQANAEAYGRAVEQLEASTTAGPSGRDGQLALRLRAAADVPARVAAIAADVAALAQLASEHGLPMLRPDAQMAAVLCSAAASGAEQLVAVNLAVQGDEDPQLVAARAAARDAALATDAALRV